MNLKLSNILQMKFSVTIPYLCLLCYVSSFKPSSDFAEIIKNLSNENHQIAVISVNSSLEIAESLFLRYFKFALVAYRIESWNQYKQLRNFALNESAIFTFDSFDSLKSFNTGVDMENKFPKRFRFYIYCESLSLEELSTMRYKVILNFQYFLVKEENVIRIMTFIFYTTKLCNVQQLVEVNSFNRFTGKWNSSSFEIDKFTNFHGCRLEFHVSYEKPYFYYEIVNGSVNVYGYHFDMIHSLAPTLNFTPRFNPLIVETDQLLYDDSLNYNMGFSAQFSLYLRFPVFMTYPYAILDVVVAAPIADKYSSFEKLFLPFDLQTWIWIIITFLASFLTILIVNFTSYVIKAFVFGEDVKTPSLNVASTFFGVSQTILPKRNFARYILVMFILYSLVIRTAYQGKMFDFLQRDVHKPEIKSIQEMIDKNFTFIAESGIRFFYPEMEFVKK